MSEVQVQYIMGKQTQRQQSGFIGAGEGCGSGSYWIFHSEDFHAYLNTVENSCKECRKGKAAFMHTHTSVIWKSAWFTHKQASLRTIKGNSWEHVCIAGSHENLSLPVLFCCIFMILLRKRQEDGNLWWIILQNSERHLYSHWRHLNLPTQDHILYDSAFLNTFNTKM